LSHKPYKIVPRLYASQPYIPHHKLSHRLPARQILDAVQIFRIVHVDCSPYRYNHTGACSETATLSLCLFILSGQLQEVSFLVEDLVGGDFPTFFVTMYSIELSVPERRGFVQLIFHLDTSGHSSESVRTPDNWTIWSNQLSILTNEQNNMS
jgi:hypothetical protein